MCLCVCVCVLQMTHHHKETKQRAEEQIDSLTCELQHKEALLHAKDMQVGVCEPVPCADAIIRHSLPIDCTW
jgi:hypothetical protein